PIAYANEGLALYLQFELTSALSHLEFYPQWQNPLLVVRFAYVLTNWPFVPPHACLPFPQSPVADLLSLLPIQDHPLQPGWLIQGLRGLPTFLIAPCKQSRSLR